jgi:hypothetical protein
MGNHNCGSVATARVRERFEFPMIVLDSLRELLF